MKPRPCQLQRSFATKGVPLTNATKTSNVKTGTCYCLVEKKKIWNGMWKQLTYSRLVTKHVCLWDLNTVAVPKGYTYHFTSLMLTAIIHVFSTSFSSQVYSIFSVPRWATQPQLSLGGYSIYLCTLRCRGTHWYNYFCAWATLLIVMYFSVYSRRFVLPDKWTLYHIE